VWKSTSELGFPENYSEDLREPPRHRADEVAETTSRRSLGAPELDFHTGIINKDVIEALIKAGANAKMDEQYSRWLKDHPEVTAANAAATAAAAAAEEVAATGGGGRSSESRSCALCKCTLNPVSHYRDDAARRRRLYHAFKARVLQKTRALLKYIASVLFWCCARQHRCVECVHCTHCCAPSPRCHVTPQNTQAQ